MFFNSLDYFIFLAVVLVLYRGLKLRGQNVLLLLASYFFYGYWDVRFLSLIWISTLVDFWVGRRLGGEEDPGKRKRLLWISMGTNLGILGFFKYFNFFIQSAQDVLGGFGMEASAWRLDLVLPVGISFYTFQTMSYTIDVYRRRMEPVKDLLDFSLFVAFFPQLVAGPIERAKDLLPQVQAARTVDGEDLQAGAWLIFWGLFKKVVIADNLAVISDAVFGGEVPLTAGLVLVGVYAFAWQIYCDFSGYTDIARGTARLMGFHLRINFWNPYFSLNPQEFWRRWHISLSTWLRDYLYFSLGGNKLGVRRTYINVALTMVLGGLWHGAAWTFVAWGAYQGAILILHRIAVGKAPEERTVSTAGRLWRMVLMFHAACLGWLFFRAESMGQVVEMLGVLVTGFDWGTEAGLWLCAMTILCLPLLVVQVCQEKAEDLLAPLRWSVVPQTALLTVCLLMLVMLGKSGGGAFIYFQF